MSLRKFKERSRCSLKPGAKLNISLQPEGVKGMTFRPRRVRKLDLHEDAILRYCGSAVAIMGFEYAESDRPIPVFADRRLRVDEPPCRWRITKSA